MLTLYGFLRSGNVYKVRLLLAHLRIPHRRIEVSQLTGDTSRPDFRAINPIGKVPTLVFDDGRMLSESGAILHYLAAGTRFWPEDRWQQAQVLRWMFFEQYSHEPAIAVNRFLRVYTGPDDRTSQIEANHRRGMHALAVMDAHLARHDWFGAERCSIADIALYAYTHVAEEGGFDAYRLQPYPSLAGAGARRTWPHPADAGNQRRTGGGPRWCSCQPCAGALTPLSIRTASPGPCRSSAISRRWSSPRR